MQFHNALTGSITIGDTPIQPVPGYADDVGLTSTGKVRTPRRTTTRPHIFSVSPRVLENFATLEREDHDLIDDEFEAEIPPELTPYDRLVQLTLRVNVDALTFREFLAGVDAIGLGTTIDVMAIRRRYDLALQGLNEEQIGDRIAREFEARQQCPDLHEQICALARVSQSTEEFFAYVDGLGMGRSIDVQTLIRLWRFMGNPTRVRDFYLARARSLRLTALGALVLAIGQTRRKQQENKVLIGADDSRYGPALDLSAMADDAEDTVDDLLAEMFGG